MNVVAVAGRISRPAEEKVLGTGDRFVGYEVSAPAESGRAETVPVVWENPPAAAAQFDVGDEVVVVGRVRRRFFRAGGATQSRTEVVVEQMVPARSAAKARRALAVASERLQA